MINLKGQDAGSTTRPRKMPAQKEYRVENVNVADLEEKLNLAAEKGWEVESWKLYQDAAGAMRAVVIGVRNPN